MIHDLPAPGYTIGLLDREGPRLERLAVAREARRRERRQLERLAEAALKRGFLPPGGLPDGRTAGPAPFLPALAVAAVKRALQSGAADPVAAALTEAARMPADPGLDNTTPNLSPEPIDSTKANLERRKRYKLQKVAQNVTRSRRVQWCGHHRIRDTVDLCISADGRATFTGVLRCANRWRCPACMAKIGAQDQNTVKDLCEAHEKAGGGFGFLTLTLPHDYGDDLERLRKIVSESFTRILTGKAWQAAAREGEVIGCVRALEVTHGLNGWHPHLHVLFLTTAPPTRAQLAGLHRHAYKIWKRYARLRGLRLPRRTLCPMKSGTAGVAAYLSKMQVAMELTRPDKKRGRRAGRTPLEILEAYAESHSPADRALWREWEAGMKGARAITFSKGIRERYGIPKRSDRQKVTAEEWGQRTALELEPGVWCTVRKTEWGEPRVKEAAENAYAVGADLGAAADAAITEILAIAREDRESRKLALYGGLGGAGPPAGSCAAA